MGMEEAEHIASRELHRISVPHWDTIDTDVYIYINKSVPMYKLIPGLLVHGHYPELKTAEARIAIDHPNNVLSSPYSPD